VTATDFCQALNISAEQEEISGMTLRVARRLLVRVTNLYVEGRTFDIAIAYNGLMDIDLSS